MYKRQTVNFNVGTNAGGGGGHAWYEWGIPGNGQDEGKRVYRMILMGLMEMCIRDSYRLLLINFIL